eukprot:TRINITY_DN9005_c0_g1_i1.p1 TRINITY_DN9005_c0_g1~~TRINITY_DN9005_c0_g1_i1.p1  ORF type:complete len:176 (+),score=68.46 TRINITY_DN9005_c0_g1_i1:46-528(+)
MAIESPPWWGWMLVTSFWCGLGTYVYLYHWDTNEAKSEMQAEAEAFEKEIVWLYYFRMIYLWVYERIALIGGLGIAFLGINSDLGKALQEKMTKQPMRKKKKGRLASRVPQGKVVKVSSSGSKVKTSSSGSGSGSAGENDSGKDSDASDNESDSGSETEE